MACLSNYTLQGVAGSCEANLAGIKKTWISYQDSYIFNVAEDSAHTLTIAENSAATPAPALYEYVFNKQTGSLTSELTKDETNGTNYYTNTLTLQFTRMEQSKHLEIEALAKEHLFAIVLDNNDELWVVGGPDGYLSLDTDTTQSGQAYDDLNGYQLSLSAMSKYKPISITKAQLETLLGE